MIDWTQHSHRRFNPLSGRWVLVSPRRADRPWQGRIESAPLDRPESYDPACYLCPGNARAGGLRNPEYRSTFVFDNDFPALRQDTPAGVLNQRGVVNRKSSRDRKGSGDHGLIRAETEPGVCRVVCFSPRHNLTLSRMDVPSIAAVVDTWCDQYRALGELPSIRPFSYIIWTALAILSAA